MVNPSSQSKVLSILPVLIALILWQLYVQITHSELLPGPISCCKALLELAVSHILFEDCVASLKRVVIGFCIAAVLGITLGLSLGLFSRLRLSLVPIIELLRPIPPLAWIPIAITFFGVGDPSSCFVIFIGAFYPVFTNTLLGVQEVPSKYIDAAKMLAASRWRICKSVIIPSALPSIFAGLRVGLGFAWACVVAAEMIAARSGLGYEIQLNRQLLQLDSVVAGMAVIGVIGVTMNTLMVWLESKCLPWKKVAHPQELDEEQSIDLAKVDKLSFLKSSNLTGMSVLLDKVKFDYGQANGLINEISLSVKTGEFFCLLGSSGCGKTSLLHLVAGLHIPRAGRIMLDGAPLNEHKPEITMVFQSGALFPWLSAQENVAFAFQSRGLSKIEALDQARSVLDIVGLSNRATNYPVQLSGGQQQRVALARALAYQPRLILLDEPFSALDSQTRESLQQEVSLLLSKMGITVILVTHDIREAVFMSDRVAVLSRHGGHILTELSINTIRPRDEAFRYSSEFSQARAELWDVLHEKSSDSENLGQSQLSIIGG